jgi:glutamate-1-semialdehyde 2,1-aminomutase
MTTNTISERLYTESLEVIPGGVNSPVRAFRSVEMTPRFIRSGRGSKILDEDGNEYIDYVGSWGPLILGHAHPAVLEALAGAMQSGTSFGAPTRRELDMARAIVRMVPSVEMVRLVNSGTEAVMSAIRLARGYTGREKIVKFSGCYHGHSDGLLAKAGSGAATFGVPDSLGVPATVVQQTVVVPFNNLEAVAAHFRAHPGETAAIVVEPVAGNMGVVPPQPGFLEGLRTLCDGDAALLIFDEVITGFRVAPGGAQELYGVMPDLTCLGKIIGGGLPVGAFGGKRAVMERLAPEGGVYQAGTLSGNPLAVAAGLTALETLAKDNPYAELESMACTLENGMRDILAQKGIPHTINRVGSMLSLFFHPGPINSYEEALRADRRRFIGFFSRMLDEGVYLAPSPFEAWFLSTAHSSDDVERTLHAVKKSL